MLQQKDKDWPNGYKNTTPIHVLYKIPTSNLGTHTELKLKGCKNIFHSNGNLKKAGVVILISDKIDFEIKIVIRDEGHYIKIKGSIQRRRYKNYKYICIQHRNTSICKANANKHE